MTAPRGTIWPINDGNEAKPEADGDNHELPLSADSGRGTAIEPLGPTLFGLTR